MGIQDRRKYDSDFKRNEVLLAQEPERSFSEVAEKLGINPDLIYQWRKTLKEKVRWHFQQGTVMRYKFIQQNHPSFPVMKMCHVLNCSKSGYYYWLKAPNSRCSQSNERLKQRIKEIFEEHGGMAGSPMITADLRSEADFFNIGKNRVARIMKEDGLKCKTVKKFVTTTNSKHKEPVADNLLNRKFNVSSPNRVWAGEITYLRVGRKWYYLSIFIDLFSRIVVGWDLNDSLARYSTIKSLDKAILKQRPDRGLLVHSDRGVQYASSDFRNLLEKKGFIQKYESKGQLLGQCSC